MSLEADYVGNEVCALFGFEHDIGHSWRARSGARPTMPSRSFRQWRQSLEREGHPGWEKLPVALALRDTGHRAARPMQAPGPLGRSLVPCRVRPESERRINPPARCALHSCWNLLPRSGIAPIKPAREDVPYRKAVRTSLISLKAAGVRLRPFGGRLNSKRPCHTGQTTTFLLRCRRTCPRTPRASTGKHSTTPSPLTWVIRGRRKRRVASPGRRSSVHM